MGRLAEGAELMDLKFGNALQQCWLWLRDAATFHPWEVRMALLSMPEASSMMQLSSVQVVSSYELAPTALLFLKKDNFVRKPLIRLIRWKLFEWFMLTVILANCITLAMDSNRPGFAESTTGIALSRSNYVFIGLFMLEAACKIIGLGFVFAEHTYLRSGECPVMCYSGITLNDAWMPAWLDSVPPYTLHNDHGLYVMTPGHLRCSDPRSPAL